jgi:hypothetical protein
MSTEPVRTEIARRYRAGTDDAASHTHLRAIEELRSFYGC